MKEKRKKTIARVGAMLAALLMVAAFTLPCLAAETKAATTLEEKYLEAYDINEYNPLYHLMLNVLSFDWAATPYVYQFSFDAERAMGTTGFVTLEGRPSDRLGITVIMGASLAEPVILVDTYWETSHTTRNGVKYVYFDLWQQSQDDGALDRVLRIRLDIGATDGILSTVTFDGVDSRLDGDGTAFTIATCSSLKNNAVLSYANSRGIVATWDTRYGYYGDFSNGFYEGTDVGYDNGYDEGYDDGEHDGYNEGMGQTNFIDFVTAIFMAPLNLIDGVLDFNIFGINLAGAVHVLLTMAILGVVITIIWKAVK